MLNKIFQVPSYMHEFIEKNRDYFYDIDINHNLNNLLFIVNTLILASPFILIGFIVQKQNSLNQKVQLKQILTLTICYSFYFIITNIIINIAAVKIGFNLHYQWFFFFQNITIASLGCILLIYTISRSSQFLTR